MTATGSYNLGDEIILREELKFLHGHYGEMVDFTVFTHDKKSALFQDDSISWATYFPHAFWSNPFANIWYLIMNIWRIARADILIVGWGGLIFDNEDGVSFDTLLSQWYFRTKIARLAGTTLVYLGISLEVKQVKNKMSLRKLFQKGDFIIVRDAKSAWLLEALEIPCSQIPDLAFLLTPEKAEKLPPKKRVGISIRGGFFWDNEEEIPKIYDYLIEKWYDPVFLLHTTEWYESQNDAIYIKRLMTWRTYNTTNTIEQSLKLYPTLYAVVWMRLHAGVLACVHSLPLIMISYWQKTEEMISLIDNAGYTLSPEKVSVSTFAKMWEDLEIHHDGLVAKMTERYNTIRSDLVSKMRNL